MANTKATMVVLERTSVAQNHRDSLVFCFFSAESERAAGGPGGEEARSPFFGIASAADPEVGMCLAAWRLFGASCRTGGELDGVPSKSEEFRGPALQQAPQPE